MLSSTIANSCKQSRRCHCKSFVTPLWLDLSPQRRFVATSKPHKKTTRHHWKGPLLSNTRALTIETESAAATKAKPTTDKDNYDSILSVALDQSKVSTAQSMLENTFSLLRKGNAELAWECYSDLTYRGIQKYISRDQYKQLIKLFNHTKAGHEQGLNYVLTLVEDMKQLGYQIGRREKLLVMRLLGRNGNLSAMETIFKDLSREQLLVVTDLNAAQKPYNIMLSCYQDHADTIGYNQLAQKSMEIYGDMLDHNLQPSSSTTALLIENIRMSNRSDEMVENVWDWVWTKIGMNVGGKTKQLDPMLYQAMVVYFSCAGRPEYALEINDIMTKKKVPRTTRMMTALIHKVGRAGHIDRAMDLLNEMTIVDGLMPNLTTLNALIDVHAHKKPKPDVAGAHRIFNMLCEMGFEPDIVTFGTMIDMYAKQGDMKNIRSIYSTMTKKHGIAPNPYICSSIIECCAILNDRKSMSDVLALLKKQVGHRGRSMREAYNLTFRYLVQGGHIQNAIVLLDMMSKENMGLEPKTFTPLLSYFAKQGDTINALKVASMMHQANVKPNKITYAILLEAYAKSGDVEGTENIFNVYKQNYHPTTYTYNALLYAYTKKNDADKLLDTYKRMFKSHVPANEITYGILMYFYSRRNEVPAVEALLDTMDSNNINPGVICRTILMQTYFESGRIEDAQQVIERMIEDGIEPTDVSWGVLIQNSVKHNQIDFAESVLQRILDQHQNQTLNILKDTTNITQSTYEKSVPETLEDVLNRQRKPPQKTISPYLFTPIIHAHIKTSNFQQARQTFNRMIEHNVPISLPTYVTMMTLYEKENNFNAVEKMWQALNQPDNKDQVVKDIDPLVPIIPVSKKTYNYFNLLVLNEDETGETEVRQPVAQQASPFALSIYLDSLAKQERHQEIELLWTDLAQKDYQFDEHNWNRYIVSLIKDGKLDKACTIVSDQFLKPNNTIEDTNERPLSIQKVVRKRDDIFASNDNQLHTRTCASFADAFQIAGAENMGELRLRSTVTEKIKDHLFKMVKHVEL
ncbi:hypothetical protein A0J61_01880 [Choanephora cucurbitarum]|uniref:PROP1-like PPR domain-containing protein n=1 Tax=Choanephora cucurbitarum TaxID=101091 RepID=A0A1C7NNM6_9FUNG|nr:hypothetical protein A0J61_01880 [Choanephora cucurbitarum]